MKRRSPGDGRLECLWREVAADPASVEEKISCLLEESSDELERTELELLLTEIAVRRGLGEEVESGALRGLVRAEELGARDLEAKARMLLAMIWTEIGQFSRAVGELERIRALDIAPEALVRATLTLSDLYSRLGRMRRAAALLDEVESGTGRTLSIELRRLTNAIFVGDPKAILSSIRYVQRAPGSAEPQIKFLCVMARGAANLQLGRADLGAKQFRKARYMNDELFRNRAYDTEARLHQAEALVVSGKHPKRAIEQTRDLVEGIDETTSPLLVAEIYRIHANALRLAGLSDESDAAFESAYEASKPSDRALFRFLALRDHAGALLDELATRDGADDLLRRVLRDARASVRDFDHPVFEWQVRVFEVLSSSRLAGASELGELEDCRHALAAAFERGEISQHHRDCWAALLDSDIEAARGDLRAALARDIEAMDEVVAGLRSEDARTHLRAFTRSVGDRLGADRITMVLEGEGADGLEVIASHCMSDAEARALGASLMSRLGPDQPVLLRDLGSARDPLAVDLREVTYARGEPESHDRRLAEEPDRRSAMVFAIDGGGVVVGLIYLDRAIDRDTPAFRTADLRDFAFLSNGLAAVSRIALARAGRETQVLRDRLRGVTRRHGILTQSPVLVRLLDRLERIADSTVPLLIVGESGTGKELVARAAHAASQRIDGPFVAVNCAAIPATLIEAELFGYTRGAFTGADRDKTGYFRAANGGTILLDEISELPIDLQAKLLRVLEEGRVTPLGRTESLATDFRILAATNADLGAAVESGAFRADLYYRIEGLKLTMPPLRDRPEDIRLLAEHFLGDNAVSMQLPADALRFTSEAMRAMERYRWPGNVRELRQAVHSSAVLRNLDTNELGVDALPEQIATAADREASIQGIDASLLDRIATVADEIGAPDLLSEIRDHLTDRALATTEGKKRAAARALGMRESTLRRQLKIRDKTKGDGGS